MAMLQHHVQSTRTFAKVWNKMTVPCACFRKNFTQTSENYYEVLGIPPTATDKEIRKAFIELSKKNHPDSNTNDKTLHDKFVRINKAYNVLISPAERKIYDEGLLDGRHVRPHEVHRPQRPQRRKPEEHFRGNYYYHPSFYEDPEMRKKAAKVWEQRTGYSFHDYYGIEDEAVQQPKHTGLTATMIGTLMISFGFLVVYIQYQRAQVAIHHQRVSASEMNTLPRNQQSPREAAGPLVDGYTHDDKEWMKHHAAIIFPNEEETKFKS